MTVTVTSVHVSEVLLRRISIALTTAVEEFGIDDLKTLRTYETMACDDFD